MSYERSYPHQHSPAGGGRGGYRNRRQREDYDHYRETPEQKLRSSIIKLGEVDPTQELPRIAQQIREQDAAVVPAISEGFRIGVTEQPYKIPYYATLLRLLHDPSIPAPKPSDSNRSPDTEPRAPLGKLILEDFWKSFQSSLDKLAWREMRLCVHFFAHLSAAHLISPTSLSALLQSFTSVLDEPGVSHGRAKRAAICAAEGLMIGGAVLNAGAVTEIIAAITSYNETLSSAKWLVSPVFQSFPSSTPFSGADEHIDAALVALHTLQSTNFSDPGSSFPRPYQSQDDGEEERVQDPFELPGVLVPPDLIELDSLSADTPPKKEEWPEYSLQLFDNDVTPDSTSPAGYAVRVDLRDIIDIFEINRKECARLLLEYPKWAVTGTFKPKPGAPADGSSVVGGSQWQLESTIVETILATFLASDSPHKPIYYISLLTELCKLSPTTVGPAVGKSIRRLYSYLSSGLDVEISRRFAEWFAVHMSNFGFGWVWKEWIPDLEVGGLSHPKRAFMRRAVEFEIRLSYHDRIKKTLPEKMQSPEAGVVGEEAPGPWFEYDDPDNPHHDTAQSVLNLFRGRAKAEDVITHLDALRSTLETSSSDLPIDDVDPLLRSICVQSLLHIGARSFSHLLNAIERYLPLLRQIVKQGEGDEAGGNEARKARSDVLSSASRFWERNRQMVGIVFDKLMQYQIVDPSDVVSWTFAHSSTHERRTEQEKGEELEVEGGSLSAFEWDLLRAALDKANGRVVIARRKVTALRKEEDEKRARVRARDDTSMEVDADTKPDETPAIDSPALSTALKAFASLTREQKNALSRTLDGFVECLTKEKARAILREEGWAERGSWQEQEWRMWETWGWYRQFCRAYAPYLRNYANTLSTVSFAKLEGEEGEETSVDVAAVLIRKMWNVAIGQE